MEAKTGDHRIRPGWWTLILIVTITAFTGVCIGFYTGSFKSYVSATLTSDRSGLVMETGARIKMRGVEVGHVGSITAGAGPVNLQLLFSPDEIKYIPANIRAEIRSSTIFGAKYVELIPPPDPSAKHLAPGAVLRSDNVSTEVNTLFQDLVGVLNQIDVAKLNATLTALADGVRGQGQRMGQAITDANQVLMALNPRAGTIAQNWRSLRGFSDAYGAAAKDIIDVLDAASTTSATITRHASDLDVLLLNTIGFSQSGINLLAPNKDNLVRAINTAQPTTDLLMEYNPEYTCTLTGVKWFLDKGGYDAMGGNGSSLVIDASLLLGDDPYRYPDNLPVVAAKGGPGGKPGCGSLPDASKNFPVRQLVTNTGWGTGLDWRPNPGIGHPWWVNFFPVTRAVPEQPSVRGQGPSAIGPVPYPGAPPYGAPQYGPGGLPLYPGMSPALQPAPPPAEPRPTP